MNQPERCGEEPLVPPHGQALREGEEDTHFDKVHQSPNKRDESAHQWLRGEFAQFEGFFRRSVVLMSPISSVLPHFMSQSQTKSLLSNIL